MNPQNLKKLLESVAEGATSVNDAMESLRLLSMEDIEYAHVDHHRSLRKGFPEVIFGQGKTAGQIAGIMEKMASAEDIILVTRIDGEKAGQVR
ncbi:MAG: 1-(5-phosphoribosyl)-5-amino-4-imidazole-carboxylate carboxylase, partial [Desulfosalsimonas sp.]